MRGVRDLFGELVQRRLWPVAMLLVVGLVAVPVVLAKHGAPQSGSDMPPPPAAVGAAAGAPGAGTASEPVVSASASPDAGAPLRGQAKNPFVQQHMPPRVTSRSTSAAAGGAGRAGGSGGGGTGPAGNAIPRGGSTTPPKTYLYSSVDVRFGRAGFPLREIKDVPRLAPLPNATRPVLIFMGTRSDHETAVFMISADVHAQGQARCVPSNQLCEAIELRRGGIALLDVTAADGSVTQYELDLTDVTLHETTSKAKASAAYARSSKAGIALVRRSAAAAAVRSELRWSAADGVLVAVPGGTYLERDGSAPADALTTPQASAGAVQRPPVLTPLP